MKDCSTCVWYSNLTNRCDKFIFYTAPTYTCNDYEKKNPPKCENCTYYDNHVCKMYNYVTLRKMYCRKYRKK